MITSSIIRSTPKTVITTSGTGRTVFATVRWSGGVVLTPPRQRTRRAVCRNVTKLYVVASRWTIIDIDSWCTDPWTYDTARYSVQIRGVCSIVVWDLSNKEIFMACSLLYPNRRSARAPEMLLSFYQQERHHIPKEVIIIFITWERHISLGISFRLSHYSQINL